MTYIQELLHESKTKPSHPMKDRFGAILRKGVEMKVERGKPNLKSLLMPEVPYICENK